MSFEQWKSLHPNYFGLVFKAGMVAERKAQAERERQREAAIKAASAALRRAAK